MPKQEMYVSMWGVLDESGGITPLSDLPALLDTIVEMGYAGIEMPIAYVMKVGRVAFTEMMAARKLKIIAQIFSSGPPPTPGNLSIPSADGIEHLPDSPNTRDVGRHKAVWNAQVDECTLLQSGGVLKSVTSHTGRDYWSPAEADDMFTSCLAHAAATGVTVHHETHRGRVLYSPWVTRDLLPRHPTLTLVADLSHFTCVAEAPCDEPELAAVVAALTPRVGHVHARVGFEEGPQVPDPRTPRWATHYAGFKAWWAAIYDAQAARGDAICSTTPEFGPAPYCPIDPATDRPIADIRAVNHGVGRDVAALFAAKFGADAAAVLSADVVYPATKQ